MRVGCRHDDFNRNGILNWVQRSVGLFSSEAIVLKTYPLGNSDKIVVAYTRKYGKLRGVAHGARRIKSRFAGRLEPFNWIEILYFEKQNRDLVTIDKIDLIQSFSSRVGSYRCFLQLNYLAELLFETIPDKEPNDSLFRLLLLVLPEVVDPLGSDLAQLYFEVWHLKISGLFPSSRSCWQCGANLLLAEQVFFNSKSNRFYCSSCRESSYDNLPLKSYHLLRQILKRPLNELILENNTSSARNDLARIVQGMLQQSFERNFESLMLINAEAHLN